MNTTKEHFQTEEKPIKKVNNTGTFYYNSEGQLRCINGRDAIIKVWYINGEYHRLDGPAIERADGYKEWWINNVKYSKEDYDEQIKVLKITKQGTEQSGLNLDI